MFYYNTAFTLKQLCYLVYGQPYSIFIKGSFYLG